MELSPQSQEKILLQFRENRIRLILDLVLVAAVIGGLIAMFSYTMLFGFIIVVALIVVGILVGGLIFLNWFLTQYTVTDVRVEYKSGVIAKMQEQLNLEDIQTIDTKHTVLGRILGDGDITIESAGNNIVLLKHVANAEEIARKISDLSLHRHKKPEEASPSANN